MAVADDDLMRMPESRVRKITVGFRFAFICFPPWEGANWHWGREDRDQMWAVGPMRLDFGKLTATREKEDWRDYRDPHCGR